MSLNSYIESMQSELIVRDSEKYKIDKSVSVIKARIESYFDSDEYCESIIFGSYDRGTMLPRRYDENSDVDIMIEFNYSGLMPQTYLNKIKNFVYNYYSTSGIHQSYPSTVLDLNHIKFELTPGVSIIPGSYYIPDKQEKWTYTKPGEICDLVRDSNIKNNSKIKPVIRLMKYWNVRKNGGGINSFELEHIIAQNFRYTDLSCSTSLDYVRNTIDLLYRHYRSDKLSTAENHLQQAIFYEKMGYTFSAEKELNKVFPELL